MKETKSIDGEESSGIGSSKNLRRLAANSLRWYRSIDASPAGEWYYSKGMAYGQYLAFKSAAWRVNFDATTEGGK